MKRTGGQIITEALIRNHVPYIIGIPGHGVLGLFDAVRQCDREGTLKYIQVKHEQSAVHMADAYFRLTGQPLATISSIGPGSINTAIGLATAYVDSSAVISLCGDTHTNMMGVGVLQEIERDRDSHFLSVLDPLVKRSWRAENVQQLPRIMNRAFQLMKTGRPGPVAVALPMDVQSDSACLGGGGFTPYDEKLSVPADAAAVDSAVKLMKNAKRPVLLLGGGALRARVAPQLTALAERWGAAVITTLAGKSAFPESHSQYAFHTGSKGTTVGLELCRSADVILALGVRFADETTCSYRKGVSFNFPETKLIQVDINTEELGKNYRPDVAVNADIASFVDQLLKALDMCPAKSDYLEEIAQKRGLWLTMMDEKRSQPDDALSISQLISIMNKALPDDTIVVSSSGNTQAQLLQEYVFSVPYTCLTSGGFSTMGWSLPASIGAKLACPDRPVAALIGDGDFLMTMQELSTLAQLNLPVTIVVADNRGWYAIKDLQRDAYGEDYTFGNDWLREGKSYTPDYAAIAKGFGIQSWHADSRESFEAALKAAMTSGRPAFIAADVCRDIPYTGGRAFGWWDVPVPGYIEERRQNYENARDEESWSL